MTSYYRRDNDNNFDMFDALLVAVFGTAGPLMAVATVFNLMFLVGIPFNSITLGIAFFVFKH